LEQARLRKTTPMRLLPASLWFVSDVHYTCRVRKFIDLPR
jgi:hypothetical protein